MRRITFLTVLTMIMSAVPTAAMAAAPNNDDFASATAVAALPYSESVSVGEATTETGEPVETCAPFANTVWYAVTLASDRDVRVDTAGSNYDTTLAVWAGTSFEDAVLIACNDDTSMGLQSALTFSAAAGTTYFVQAGAFFEAPSDAVLNISFAKPKPGVRPTIQSDRFRGSIAEAFNESYDDATGGSSFAGVQVIDGSVKTKGQRPEQFSVLVVNSSESAYDEASDVYTFTDWYGMVDLASDQFSMDRRLAGASVSAGLTMYGFSCIDDFANQTFECVDLGPADVTVDVAWSGEGRVIPSSWRSSDQYDGFRMRFSGRSDSRSATVAGGAYGDLIIDLEGAFGRLSNEASGSWFWASADAGGGFFATGTSLFQSQMQDTGLAGTPSIMFDRFSGSFADAYQEHYDEENGGYGYQQVSLTSGRSKVKGDRWVSTDQVWVYGSEDSFDEVARTVTSTVWYGGTEVGADEFSIDRKLGSASVVTSVPMVGETCTYSYNDDSFECESIGETTVDVEIDWEGVGAISQSSSSYQDRYDGMTYSFRGRFSGRSAIVTGHVSGDLFDWDMGGAYGQLGRQAMGSWYKS
ncbi:MAG: hypothetical protein OEY98_00930 [Acidimicrobiia bacterium]|nr:hypothetical protein [Acidimicrobiia bacterium]